MSELTTIVNEWKRRNLADEEEDLKVKLVAELRRVIDENSVDDQYVESLEKFRLLQDLDVRVYRSARNDGAWGYKSIEFESGEFAYFIAVPGRLNELERTGAWQAPPTAAVDALVFAILQAPELFENEFSESCVVGVTKSVGLEMKSADFSWIACSLGGMQPRFMSSAFWLSDKTQISADLARFKISRTMFRILSSAYSASQVEYRFLGFYRVLEARLRKNILDRIQKDFLLNPSATLQAAGKLLEAEMKQLGAVVEEYDLNKSFEEIAESWKVLKSNNRFAALIDRKCERNDGAGGQSGKFVKGVAVVYQCRCAIVHTADGIIYEEFEDADEEIGTIVPFIEQAALSCIGVSLVD